MHENSPRVCVRKQTMTMVSAILSASLMVSASGSPPELQKLDAQRNPPAATDAFQAVSADITVTQGLVSQAGKPVGAPVPPARYRWQRKKNGRYWKTTMTMTSSVRPPVRLLSGAMKVLPPAIVRIEDDGDGTAPRFYDQRDNEIRPPRAADITRSSAALGGSAFAVPTGTSRATGTQPLRTIDESWTRSIVVMRSDAKARRDELLRRFGPVVGQLRGLDRFVTAVEDGSVEILIDPQTNVIREWNLVKKGELEARGSSAYELAAGDTLLRRNARVERLLPNGSGSRMATEVDLANVRFESR